MQENLFRLDRRKVMELMQAQKLKQWWVAETSGIHVTTLRRWLTGSISRVNGYRLDALAQTLCVKNSDIAQREV